MTLPLNLLEFLAINLAIFYPPKEAFMNAKLISS